MQDRYTPWDWNIYLYILYIYTHYIHTIDLSQSCRQIFRSHRASEIDGHQVQVPKKIPFPSSIRRNLPASKEWFVRAVPWCSISRNVVVGRVFLLMFYPYKGPVGFFSDH